jgi:hypothetical protein
VVLQCSALEAEELFTPLRIFSSTDVIQFDSQIVKVILGLYLAGYPKRQVLNFGFVAQNSLLTPCSGM